MDNARIITLTFQELYGKIMLDHFDLPADVDEDMQQRLLADLMTGPIQTVRCRGFKPYQVIEGGEYLVAVRSFYDGKIRAKKPDTIEGPFWQMIEGSLEKVFDTKRIDLEIDFKEISN